MQIHDVMDKKLFIGTCYFSPVGSHIWTGINRNPFEALEEDIVSLSKIGDIIIGDDFNARTGTSKEIIPLDMSDRDSFTSHTNMHESLVWLRDIIPQHQLPVRKNTDDTEPNNYGQQLLQICGNTGT